LLKTEFNTPSTKFVESIGQSIEKEVSKGGDNNVEKGHLFLKWILTKVFNATEDDAENGIVDGPNDQGIDAILEIQGTEMNFFRIFQSKYGKSHSVDAIRAFKAKINEFLEQKPNDLTQGRIRDALINIKDKGWDCEAVYVTNNQVDLKGDENFQIFGKITWIQLNCLE